MINYLNRDTNLENMYICYVAMYAETQYTKYRHAFEEARKALLSRGYSKKQISMLDNKVLKICMNIKRVELDHVLDLKD